MLKVIGIGNALRGDDAIGPVIIEKLLNDHNEIPALFIDAGADAFTVLQHLMEPDPILLIDCARMGKKPGEIALFNVDEASIKMASNMVSLHGFSFSAMYNMAKEMGPVASCKIIGIEPKEIQFDTSLSEEVKMSIPKIISLVNKEAFDYA